MIKRIILAAALLCSVSVTACEINYASELSDSDKQELKILCEQKRAKAIKQDASGIVSTVEEIDPKTIDKIQAITKAIVDAVLAIANGLGVAVNTFIQSPAGIIITTMLVFYLIGSKIWGIFILVVIALIIRGLLNRTKRVNSTGQVTEETVPVLWGLYTRTVRKVQYVPYKEWSESDRSNYIGACWLSAGVMIVAIIIIALNA